LAVFFIFSLSAEKCIVGIVIVIFFVSTRFDTSTGLAIGAGSVGGRIGVCKGSDGLGRWRWRWRR
jgi:hypothetical protein